MTTEQDLLNGIAENPDDDTGYLVYADWWDEEGDPARGELIRLQVELEGLSTPQITLSAMEEWLGARVQKNSGDVNAAETLGLIRHQFYDEEGNRRHFPHYGEFRDDLNVQQLINFYIAAEEPWMSGPLGTAFLEMRHELVEPVRERIEELREREQELVNDNCERWIEQRYPDGLPEGMEAEFIKGVMHFNPPPEPELPPTAQPAPRSRLSRLLSHVVDAGGIAATGALTAGLVSPPAEITSRLDQLRPYSLRDKASQKEPREEKGRAMEKRVSPFALLFHKMRDDPAAYVEGIESELDRMEAGKDVLRFRPSGSDKTIRELLAELRRGITNEPPELESKLIVVANGLAEAANKTDIKSKTSWQEIMDIGHDFHTIAAGLSYYSTKSLAGPDDLVKRTEPYAPRGWRVSPNLHVECRFGANSMSVKVGALIFDKTARAHREEDNGPQIKQEGAGIGVVFGGLVDAMDVGQASEYLFSKEVKIKLPYALGRFTNKVPETREISFGVHPDTGNPVIFRIKIEPGMRPHDAAIQLFDQMEKLVKKDPRALEQWEPKHIAPHPREVTPKEIIQNKKHQDKPEPGIGDR